MPRAYYEVASVNLDEMDDLYSIRVAIEERVAERVVLQPENESLRELLAFWSAPPTDVVGDVNLVFADELFHETLATASGSTVLVSVLTNNQQTARALEG